MKPDLIFLYRNYKGEVGVRRVTCPESIGIKKSLWHEGAQPIMTAWDIERESAREFAVNDILAFLHDAEETPPPKDGTECDLWVRSPRDQGEYLLSRRSYVHTLGWCERGMQIIMKKDMKIIYWRKSP